MGFFDKAEDINTGSDADRVSQLEHRVAQLEATVTQLQQQVATSPPPYGPPQPTPPATASPAAASMSPALGVPAAVPDWMNQVRLLKQQGQEIPAIKLYRENTGVGLREAKDYVDGLV